MMNMSQHDYDIGEAENKNDIDWTMLTMITKIHVGAADLIAKEIMIICRSFALGFLYLIVRCERMRALTYLLCTP